MTRLFLILTIIGFFLPNILVLQESIETGNWLLYGDPLTTVNQLFANRISTIFGIDLLFGVFVFIIWSWQDATIQKVNHVWVIWLLTMAFGFAFGFPLYLYLRSRKKSKTTT